MKKHLLMAGAVVAALAIPLAANAQSGATTGAVGGAVGGAIVGGPVGAVVGGVGGAIIVRSKSALPSYSAIALGARMETALWERLWERCGNERPDRAPGY